MTRLRRLGERGGAESGYCSGGRGLGHTGFGRRGRGAVRGSTRLPGNGGVERRLEVEGGPDGQGPSVSD